jgi:zinc protease
MDIAARDEVDTDKPLMAKLPKPGTIKSQKDIKELGVKEYKLSNGVTVMTKKTDFKNDQVMIRAFSYGGTSLASDEEYYSAAYASGIIDESGVADFDKSTLEKMLSGKQVSISPMLSDLVEGINGGCAPRDIETMFQLTHLYFTQPRKDDNASRAYIKRMTEYIRNMGINPNSVFNDTITAVMGNYHMRAMPATPEIIEKVNPEKAYNFFKQRFEDATDFKFFIVGNFDEAELENLMKTYLASLPAKGKTDYFKDHGIKAPKGSFRKDVFKGIEPKTSVRIIINGDFDYNRQNMHALRSMMEIFSVRLREVIREDLGGVYGIGAFPQINQFPKPNYRINIMFGTSIERTEELITAIKQVVDEMKAGTLEASYIDNAKEIMRREHEINLKENSWWMNVLYNYTYNKEDFDYIINYDKYINSITLAGVTEAAKKYLDMGNWKEFILYPED